MERRLFLAGGIAIAAAPLERAGAMSVAGIELIGRQVVVIARWPDVNGRTIVLQDFTAAGEHFIPIFSEAERFKAETAGSGFEHEGVEIDLELLVSILRGDELLILNPASTKLHLRKSDLQALVTGRSQ